VDGSELWGRNMGIGLGKEDRSREIGEKILKMGFGSGGRTPKYMVRKEIQRDKLGKSREESVGF